MPALESFTELIDRKRLKHADYIYQKLLRQVLRDGEPRDDRTGTGTISILGPELTFPLGDSFPLLTTKRLHTKSIVAELLMFINGITNNNYLKEQGVSIWDEWARSDGDLGPIYGKQWRSWITKDGKEIDQLNEVIEKIKKNPNDRRLLVSAWNPSDIPDMALPPCHWAYQFYVNREGLSCKMFQRSVDVFLGLPYNIASYALLTHIVADLTGLKAHELRISLGDTHIYKNHLAQVHEQLKRKPKSLPRLEITHRGQHQLEDYRLTDFVFHGYSKKDTHPSIKAPISV